MDKILDVGGVMMSQNESQNIFCLETVDNKYLFVNCNNLNYLITDKKDTKKSGITIYL